MLMNFQSISLFPKYLFLDFALFWHTLVCPAGPPDRPSRAEGLTTAPGPRTASRTGSAGRAGLQNIFNNLLHTYIADSEIRMHDGNRFFPNPSILIDLSIKDGPGRF